jgi:hypothetical protein
MKSQQEILLSEDLHQIVAGQPFAPDVAAITARARHLRRRTIAVRGAAGLGAAAGVTAVALVVSGVVGLPASQTRLNQAQAGSALSGSGPSGSGPASSAPAPSAAAPSVHTIEARTVAAVTGIGADSVLRTVVRTGDDVNRFTADQPDQVSAYVHSVRGRKANEVVTRQAPGQPGVYQMRVVNYSVRTWSQHVFRGMSASPIPNPARDYLTVFKPSANGRVRFVGSGTVNGIPAYKISFTALDSAQSTGFDWISKATYLPIKGTSPGGVTVTYRWSGAGSVRGASLWPSVPAGFARVPFLQAEASAKGANGG